MRILNDIIMLTLTYRKTQFQFVLPIYIYIIEKKLPTREQTLK